MLKFEPLASSSMGNAYVVSNGRTRILIECGIPIKRLQELTNYNLKFDGVLISHEHNDHSKCISDLLRLGLDLYASAGTYTAKDINITFNTHVIQSGKAFKIGDLVIYPFATKHDANEPLGFIVADKDDRLLFATDTYYIEYVFPGITLMAIEANYDSQILDNNMSDGSINNSLANRVIRSHMSIDTTVKYLRSADISALERIYLLHLSNTNANPKMFLERMKREFPQIETLIAGG